MATRDTIVIGASAGGVQALMQLVSALPANIPARHFRSSACFAELAPFVARDSATGNRSESEPWVGWRTNRARPDLRRSTGSTFVNRR